MPDRTRVLLVDDEAGIRVTVTAILQQNGFDVTEAASVAEALREINSQQFNVLISDLNIGEPGDGFTVVSAMRRTQPICVNFILTGYPAFESALLAIRNQVDDYLVKPTNVQELVTSVKDKLNSPRETRPVQSKPMAAFLAEHQADIQGRMLKAMKSHPRLSVMPLSDQQRTDHIPRFLQELVRFLEAEGALLGLPLSWTSRGCIQDKSGCTGPLLS